MLQFLGHMLRKGLLPLFVVLGNIGYHILLDYPFLSSVGRSSVNYCSFMIWLTTISTKLKQMKWNTDRCQLIASGKVCLTYSYRSGKVINAVCAFWTKKNIIWIFILNYKRDIIKGNLLECDFLLDIYTMMTACKIVRL